MQDRQLGIFGHVRVSLMRLAEGEHTPAIGQDKLGEFACATKPGRDAQLRLEQPPLNERIH